MCFLNFWIFRPKNAIFSPKNGLKWHRRGQKYPQNLKKMVYELVTKLDTVFELFWMFEAIFRPILGVTLVWLVLKSPFTVEKPWFWPNLTPDSERVKNVDMNAFFICVSNSWVDADYSRCKNPCYLVKKSVSISI